MHVLTMCEKQTRPDQSEDHAQPALVFPHRDALSTSNPAATRYDWRAVGATVAASRIQLTMIYMRSQKSQKPEAQPPLKVPTPRASPPGTVLNENLNRSYAGDIAHLYLMQMRMAGNGVKHQHAQQSATRRGAAWEQRARPRRRSKKKRTSSRTESARCQVHKLILKLKSFCLLGASANCELFSDWSALVACRVYLMRKRVRSCNDGIGSAVPYSLCTERPVATGSRCMSPSGSFRAISPSMGSNDCALLST